MFKIKDTSDKLYTFVYARKAYNVLLTITSDHYGFTHHASLANTTYTATVHYLNRTWEKYDFQCVIRELFEGILNCALKEAEKDKRLCPCYVKEDLKRVRAYKALLKKVEKGDYKTPMAR